MTCRAVAAALTLVALSAAPAIAQDASPWTVEGRIGAVSDYRDRGYTLSAEDPVLQGEFTVSHSSGLYGGVWGAGLPTWNGACTPSRASRKPRSVPSSAAEKPSKMWPR